MKKFNIFIKENINDLDPYGEEDWNDLDIHDFWNLIKDNNVFKDKIFGSFYNQDGEIMNAIDFSLDYPHRGQLEFAIEKNDEEEITLSYWKRYTWKCIVLKKATFEELWNGITFLVEGVLKKIKLI